MNFSSSKVDLVTSFWQPNTLPHCYLVIWWLMLSWHYSVGRASVWFHTVSNGTICSGFKSHQCLLAGTYMRTTQLLWWLPRGQQVSPQRWNLRQCVTFTPLLSVNKAADSGFQSQKRCNQKYKTWISVAPKKYLCLPKIYLKIWLLMSL